MHAVGGNCDWDPDGPDNQRQIYGALRSGDWKLIIGRIGNLHYLPLKPKNLKYFILFIYVFIYFIYLRNY